MIELFEHARHLLPTKSCRIRSMGIPFWHYLGSRLAVPACPAVPYLPHLVSA